MSNVMRLAFNNTDADKTDYKNLYHTVFNHLTAIHTMIEKAQLDVEEQYLHQTGEKMPLRTGIVGKRPSRYVKHPITESKDSDYSS